MRRVWHWLLLPAWIGSYWYGPPYTYGFGGNIAYTPWAGWHMGFGFGWSWGAATISVGWGWGAYPWWGGYGWGGYYPWAYGPGGGVMWGPRGGYGAWGPGYWGGINRQHVLTGGDRRQPSRDVRAATTRGPEIDGPLRQGARTTLEREPLRPASAASSETSTRATMRAARAGAPSIRRPEQPLSGAAVTVGNVGSGNQVSAGQGAIRGPGGNTTTVGGIKGQDAGALRVGDDLYAGKDGNVYKRGDDGGWDTVSRPEPRERDRTPQVDRSNLDRERASRAKGNDRAGAVRSGGYHGGARGGARGGGMPRGGGGRRR